LAALPNSANEDLAQKSPH